MRRIGLIGGISWEASNEYYKLINTEVRNRLGASHSAECIMYSFNFGEVADLQHKGDWQTLTDKMVLEAKRLEQAGSECLVICANTMHKMVDAIEAETDFEIIHIADVTGKKVQEKGLRKVGLIGTKYVMGGNFYQQRIQNLYGIDVIVPSADNQEIIHDVIYNELVQGKILESSREKYLKVIQSLVDKGAEGIILGCTEIPLLIKQDHLSIPVFDTMTIHAMAAVDFALEGSKE